MFSLTEPERAASFARHKNVQHTCTPTPEELVFRQPVVVSAYETASTPNRDSQKHGLGAAGMQLAHALFTHTVHVHMLFVGRRKKVIQEFVCRRRTTVADDNVAS